jgi:DNA topoisomerase-1
LCSRENALRTCGHEPIEEQSARRDAKRDVTKAIERVAERLGNTKAVFRKCYVHPAVIDAHMDRSRVATLKARTETELRTSLSQWPAQEAAVRALLQQRMERPISADKNRGRHGIKGSTGRGRAGRRHKRTARVG